MGKELKYTVKEASEITGYTLSYIAMLCKFSTKKVEAYSSTVERKDGTVRDVVIKIENLFKHGECWKEGHPVAIWYLSKKGLDRLIGKKAKNGFTHLERLEGRKETIKGYLTTEEMKIKEQLLNYNKQKNEK